MEAGFSQIQSQIIVHGFKHSEIYNTVGPLDEDDISHYTTTDKSDMDEPMASAPSKLLVSDVQMGQQTEEKRELEDTEIDDFVIISNSD